MKSIKNIYNFFDVSLLSNETQSSFRGTFGVGSKKVVTTVCDARTGACLSTLYVDGLLNACAFHPEREHIGAVGASGVYFLRWVR